MPGSPSETPPLCWICQKRPAGSSEHKFKASDLRFKAPSMSQQRPIYLQRDGRATNTKVGSAKATALTFSRSICAYCNNTLTQPYDLAWQHLSRYLHAHWAEIRRRRRFNVSSPFPGGTRAAALRVHLFFVKLFGCKIVEDCVPINLGAFSKALLECCPHPEIAIFIADSTHHGQGILAYDSDVAIMSNQGELHGAMWMYRIDPVAVKVGYIKADAARCPCPAIHGVRISPARL